MPEYNAHITIPPLPAGNPSLVANRKLLVIAISTDGNSQTHLLEEDLAANDTNPRNVGPITLNTLINIELLNLDATGHVIGAAHASTKCIEKTIGPLAKAITPNHLGVWFEAAE
jgi:hypothetical protein